MAYKLTRRPSRRDGLFEAAARLVADHGVEALTFDGLAKAAGVTKAGVQYHFASKDALVEGLLTHLLETFDHLLEAHANEEPKPGAWLRAYVGLTFWHHGSYDAAAATLLTALPPGDRRGSAYARYAVKWRSRAANDGIDPGIGQAVRLAADAFWLERAHGAVSEAETELIRAALLKLIEDNTR